MVPVGLVCLPTYLPSTYLPIVYLPTIYLPTDYHLTYHLSNLPFISLPIAYLIHLSTYIWLVLILWRKQVSTRASQKSNQRTPTPCLHC